MFEGSDLSLGLGGRATFAVLAALLLGLAGGCNGGAQTRKPDGSTPATDGPATSPDVAGTDAAHVGTAALGHACSTGTDCASTFCVDSVCCNAACAGACLTCAAVGSVGTCIPADVHTNPRNGCTDKGVASCGNDGFCDGTGTCENYAAGAMCQTAGCTGSTLTFAGRCDGLGTCVTPTSQSCAPWTCGSTGACKTTCSADADCAAGNFCVAGSCGLKPPGASCGAGTDCKSTICAQGVCCSTACTGTCKSCGLTGSAGNCTNVPAGQDPAAECADQGATSCKTNGSCDGMGACQLYPATTVCGTNTCTAGTETVAGKCDGVGTCQAGTTQGCGAYACDTTGVCKTKCAADADCAAGDFCIATVCTKKAVGATCASGGDCTTGHCEQGVCCNTACTGTCMSCNLATPGTCAPIVAGMDPLNQCADVGGAGGTNPCGTNGSCDGAGACQFYPAGLNCGAASCTGMTLTQARTCDGAGTCRVAMTAMCSPYICGTAACKTTCTANTDCVSPNVCTSGSCGKNPIGATCTLATDCGSGFCAQGICCNSACTGTCQSCALAGSQGTCAPVPSGMAPATASQCATTAASTCGTDGTCNGAGACRSYVSGTQCAASTCTGTSFTAPRLCNGAGICGTATPTACGGSLICDTNGQCKATCASSADCVSPNLCNTTTGTCGLKGIGVTCATGPECASGFCAQGVCCSSACAGTCMSCALGGASLGTCTNVPKGTAPTPATQCATTLASTCGTNGLCDGAAKCQLYSNTTTCVAGTCTGDTLTPARICDGAGNCKAVTTTLCDPFACGASNACNATCTVNADCTAPATCIGGSCGKLSQGAACTTAASCATGFCANGVCCNNACAGVCAACNLTGMVGTCTSIPGGTVPNPTSQCTDTGPNTCGTNGFCNGSGACQKYASGTTCGAASCTGSTLTGTSTCNTSGTCVTPATSACNPYICGTGACKSSCTTTADCSTPYVCTGGICVSPVNLTVSLRAENIGNNQIITANWHVVNNGTSAIPLTQLTVRYWYTIDAGATTETVNCDYSALPGACGALVYSAASFVLLTTPKTTADHYFQFGFTNGAGNLAANGGATGDIQLRWNKSDFSAFNQANDYSYNGSTTGWTATTKVTAYLNGALVYGTEP